MCMMGNIKIKIDREKCIGTSNCEMTAPRVFGLDAQCKAVVKNPRVADDATIMQAARECPTKAIVLFNEKTGEQLYP